MKKLLKLDNQTRGVAPFESHFQNDLRLYLKSASIFVTVLNHVLYARVLGLCRVHRTSSCSAHSNFSQAGVHSFRSQKVEFESNVGKKLTMQTFKQIKKDVIHSIRTYRNNATLLTNTTVPASSAQTKKHCPD